MDEYIKSDGKVKKIRVNRNNSGAEFTTDGVRWQSFSNSNILSNHEQRINALEEEMQNFDNEIIIKEENKNTIIIETFDANREGGYKKGDIVMHGNYRYIATEDYIGLPVPAPSPTASITNKWLNLSFISRMVNQQPRKANNEIYLYGHETAVSGDYQGYTSPHVKIDTQDRLVDSRGLISVQDDMIYVTKKHEQNEWVDYVIDSNTVFKLNMPYRIKFHKSNSDYSRITVNGDDIPLAPSAEGGWIHKGYIQADSIHTIIITRTSYGSLMATVLGYSTNEVVIYQGFSTKVTLPMDIIDKYDELVVYLTTLNYWPYATMTPTYWSKEQLMELCQLYGNISQFVQVTLYGYIGFAPNYFRAKADLDENYNQLDTFTFMQDDNCNHPNWITFDKNTGVVNLIPEGIIYIAKIIGKKRGY